MNDEIQHEAWSVREGPELLDAVRHGNVPEVLRRLEQGLSSNWQDTEGCSALFHAVHRRQWAVVDALLARGASIDLPDFRDWTPLFWAAFNGHGDIVTFLIGRGADPDVPTADGRMAPVLGRLQRSHGGCPPPY